MSIDTIETEYGPATIEPWRGGWRVNIPDYAIAVGPTPEAALAEALRLAQREARYQQWKATARPGARYRPLKVQP